MQPNNREVGVILEPTDIDVANSMRVLLWEKFDSGKPPEAQQSTFKTPLQPNEQGQLELDESAARHIAHQASVAHREVRHTYGLKDKKFDSLMAAQLFDTDEYKTLEVVLPLLEDRIRTFGSFATAVEGCISQSQDIVQNQGLATQ